MLDNRFWGCLYSGGECNFVFHFAASIVNSFNLISNKKLFWHWVEVLIWTAQSRY